MISSAKILQGTVRENEPAAEAAPATTPATAGDSGREVAHDSGKAGPKGRGNVERMEAVASGGRAVIDREDENAPSLRQVVYDELSMQLITGRIAPGVAISTRRLAKQMGVSQMPVRDALGRLATEGAVEIRSKRAVMVQAMTPERFQDIMRCRLLLEPAAAVDALPHIDSARLLRIRAADRATDQALVDGDIHAYMESNFRFHSLIYRANPMPTLNRLIESLWIQFGPFMRLVYGRVGTANMVDQHRVATAAIAEGNAEKLEQAIRDDIGDGMELIREQV